MSKLVVGSDPECFLRDSMGNLVSSIGIIPGHKHRPTKTAHGSIQPDNITAEFNSIPSKTKEEFILHHQLIIGDLKEAIAPLDLNLDFIPSVMAEPIMLMEPAARMAGCEPDYNVWTGKQNSKPDYSETLLRCAGGHLHISFDTAEIEGNRERMVKALDLVLGLPSVLLDSDSQRRELYGKAGSFRPKFLSRKDPYDGLEYRTLSNFWLGSETIMGFIWEGVERAYNNLQELSNIADSISEDLKIAINSSNKDLALKLIQDHNVICL